MDNTTRALVFPGDPLRAANLWTGLVWTLILSDALLHRVLLSPRARGNRLLRPLVRYAMQPLAIRRVPEVGSKYPPFDLLSSMLLAIHVTLTFVFCWGRSGINYDIDFPRLGYHAVAAFSIAVMSALRYSPLRKLGVPHHYGLRWHRVLGMTFVALATAHAVSYLRTWGVANFTAIVLGDNPTFRWGVVAWSFCLLAFVPAPFRPIIWNVFKVVHITGALGVLIAASLHTTYARRWTIVAGAMWSIDWGCRLAHQYLVPSGEIVPGGFAAEGYVTTLVVRLPHSRLRRLIAWYSEPPFLHRLTISQFVFVSVPHIESFTSHPVSIVAHTEREGADEFILALASRGNFTRKLRHAAALATGENVEEAEAYAIDAFKAADPAVSAATHAAAKRAPVFPVHIEGPFQGILAPLEAYSRPVLIAGGVGLTPMLGMLATMVQRPPSTTHMRPILVWIVRTRARAQWAAPFLTRIASRVTIFVYFTGFEVPIVVPGAATDAAGDAAIDDDAAPAPAAPTAEWLPDTVVSRRGRPRFAALFRELIDDMADPDSGAQDDEAGRRRRRRAPARLVRPPCRSTRDVGIYACGPDAMFADVHRGAAEVSRHSSRIWAVHGEEFNW